MPIELEDEETGEQLLLDTSDKSFRDTYLKLVREKNSKLKKTMQKLKIDLVEIKSDEPFEIPLRKFFRLRQKRLNR